MAAENSGGRVNYYLVEVKHPQREDQPPYRAECEDLIEALDLNFDEANMFKEIWRGARARQGAEKEGNTALRGAQKLVHYAGRILRRISRVKESEWIPWEGMLSYPSELTLTDTVIIRTADGSTTSPRKVGSFTWMYAAIPNEMQEARITHYRKV